jgi:hypothetical protein
MCKLNIHVAEMKCLCTVQFNISATTHEMHLINRRSITSNFAKLGHYSRFPELCLWVNNCHKHPVRNSDTETNFPQVFLDYVVQMKFQDVTCCWI